MQPACAVTARTGAVGGFCALGEDGPQALCHSNSACESEQASRIVQRRMETHG